jgi:hypothetical protein
MLIGNQICRMEAKRRFLLTDKHFNSLQYSVKYMNGKYKKAYLFDISDIIKIALEVHGSIENIEYKINKKKLLKL